MTEDPSQEATGSSAGEQVSPAEGPIAPDRLPDTHPATTPQPSDPPDSEWYNGGDEASQGGTKPPIKEKQLSLEDRQYRLAVMLIALYAAGNICLGAGWLLGFENIAIMSAIVGNIGTLVAAVVAFYFAEPKNR